MEFLKNLLSKLKKKERKSGIEDYQDKKETLDEEEMFDNDLMEEETEDEILEKENENIPEEVSAVNGQKDNSKEKKLKKLSFQLNLKGGKTRIVLFGSLAAVLVIGGGAAFYFYETAGTAQQYNQQEEPALSMNGPSFTPPHRSPHRRQERHRNNFTAERRHNRSVNRNRQQSLAIVHQKHAVNNVRMNMSKNTYNKKVGKPLPSSATRISQASLNIQNFSPEQIKKKINETNIIIRKMQKHLTHAQLTGQNDPIGLVDKTVMENRNFDLYLQSQIRLMQKLITYYKQKAELEKTLQLYEMAFSNKNNKNSNTNNKINQNQNSEQKKIEEETKVMQRTLQQLITPLQQEVSALKQKLEQQQQKNKGASQNNTQQFSKMAKMSLNDLNIFIKDGKYIAVVHTPLGDKIFKEGNYFNGYKIDKILPNVIIFERNGQKYYYTYNQVLGEKYEVAKIKLPGRISETNLRTNNKNAPKVKQYKVVSRQEILRRLLQQRLQQMQKQ